jgi:hypothetical protein
LAGIGKCYNFSYCFEPLVGGTFVRILKLASCFPAILFLVGTFHFAIAQEGNDTAKAEALIRDVIKTRGGDAYLKVRSVIGRGTYTAFEKGESGLPSEFVDYVVYPNRERTEFGKGDHKYIQTNSGDEGWIYEAAQKAIRPQTEEQVKNFTEGLRHDLDNLLKQGWQEQGTKLIYVGRREIWKNTFSEAIRVEFADGLSLTLHIDARAKLPLMIEYARKYKNEDGEERLGDNQVRFFRWINFGGIQFPTIQDSYRNGKQTMRVNYDSVNINAQIPDKLFAKPNNIKDVK